MGVELRVQVLEHQHRAGVAAVAVRARVSAAPGARHLVELQPLGRRGLDGVLEVDAGSIAPVGRVEAARLASVAADRRGGDRHAVPAAAHLSELCAPTLAADATERACAAPGAALRQDVEHDHARRLSRGRRSRRRHGAGRRGGARGARRPGRVQARGARLGGDVQLHPRGRRGAPEGRRLSARLRAGAVAGVAAARLHGGLHRAVHDVRHLQDRARAAPAPWRPAEPREGPRPAPVAPVGPLAEDHGDVRGPAGRQRPSGVLEVHRAAVARRGQQVGLPAPPAIGGRVGGELGRVEARRRGDGLRLRAAAVAARTAGVAPRAIDEDADIAAVPTDRLGARGGDRARAGVAGDRSGIPAVAADPRCGGREGEDPVAPDAAPPAIASAGDRVREAGGRRGIGDGLYRGVPAAAAVAPVAGRQRGHRAAAIAAVAAVPADRLGLLGLVVARPVEHHAGAVAAVGAGHRGRAVHPRRAVLALIDDGARASARWRDPRDGEERQREGGQGRGQGGSGEGACTGSGCRCVHVSADGEAAWPECGPAAERGGAVVRSRDPRPVGRTAAFPWLPPPGAG